MTEYEYAVDPELYPDVSTAFEGYVWKVKTGDDVVFIVDVDELAATEEKRDREVTLVEIGPRLDELTSPDVGCDSV